ncbi:zinc finger protein 2 isoform X48 [Tribolium castaneum]|uniref:zinc finger protein 2 isoform X48 n=1 Tax=Tribolium castaneum TaxID=7070 RepID=UPI0030FE9AF2
MGSIENISELCRLCLVKDQVNVPIFEENATKEQTFVKINSCLPVKVSRDDSLPKKICDGCSCKLDMLYTFRNTSVDSEKQLLKWLNQAGLSCSQSAVKDPLASTKPEVTIKQETFEPTDSRDDLGLDTHSYIMQQQKLPYSQEFEFGEPSESNVGLMTDEPAPKKAKRAAALNKASVETDEDDLDAAMQITKAEDEDSDEIDQPEYVEAPSTSADDQPGPSGVNKTTVEAPSENTPSTEENSYECQVCYKQFSSPLQLSRHKLRHREKKHKCPNCDKTFVEQWELNSHVRVGHLGKKRFFCDLCDYKTIANNKLQEHIVRKHTRDFKFKCDDCNKGFLNARALTSHKEVAHEGLRFACEFCSKSFASKDTCRIHMQQHDPNHVEAKLPCPHCPKAFFRKQALVHHIRVHTKEKPFKCSECSKGFTQKGTLNVHIRYHTGERPFKCDLCQKGYVTKTDLRAHKCKGVV